MTTAALPRRSTLGPAIATEPRGEVIVSPKNEHGCFDVTFSMGDGFGIDVAHVNIGCVAPNVDDETSGALGKQCHAPGQFSKKFGCDLRRRKFARGLLAVIPRSIITSCFTLARMPLYRRRAPTKRARLR
jgi:hypothetical protein